MMMLCGSSVAYGGSGFEVVTLEENIKYLAPGIKETKRISLETGEMQHVDYACEIDLSKGTNEFFLGYREGELTTVSEQIADTEAKTGKNVVVGVNGCFYNMETAEPIGLLVSEGKVLYEATRGNTFFITREGEAKIMDIADICYDEKGNCTPVQDGQFQFAIGGSSMLLELDEETGEVKVIDGGDQDIKHSRTAVGVKADGTVVLFSTNGKMSPFNYGYTLTELGMVMKAKGCVQAMNLDGGGSVTYVSQHPGEKKDVRKTIGSDATQRNVCAGILVATTASEDGVFSKNEAKALQSSLSQCEQKGHDYVSTAKYVTCKTCGKRTPIKSFSGLATEKSSGGMQLLHKGKARTGYVPYDMFQVHYYNKKGISCEVELKKKKLPGCT
ncbi:MAG: phosphodiester glycosidase family protein, partial [Firmicutes bacterium]|nr:phosphodiester glycosidase family protein [Bacillota bacterium]